MPGATLDAAGGTRAIYLGNDANVSVNATATVVATPGAANASVISIGGDGIVSVADIVRALGPGDTASGSLNSVVSVSGQLDGDFGSLGGIYFIQQGATAGTPILDYSTLCTPGALSFTQAASPLVLMPLSNGVDYDCAITARNGLGSGPPVSVAVRPSVQLFGEGFE